MFSGFDNIAEGLKRFSLDALQREEETNENKAPKRTHVVPDIPIQPRAPDTTPGRFTGASPAITRSSEDDEWNWQPGDPGQVGKPSTRMRKPAAQRGNEVRLKPSPTEVPSTSVEMGKEGNVAASKEVARAPSGISTSGPGDSEELRGQKISWIERNMIHYNVKVPDLDDGRGAGELSPGGSNAAGTLVHSDSTSAQQVKTLLFEKYLHRNLWLLTTFCSSKPYSLVLKEKSERI